MIKLLQNSLRLISYKSHKYIYLVTFVLRWCLPRIIINIYYKIINTLFILFKSLKQVHHNQLQLIQINKL